ncbi:hypothetical protein [Polaromonas aquatica]|uniref:hypothetical protein n=1 Tax=Polaromonas aquatica TaxID=332657 RepID=UPI003D64BCC4
MLLKTNLRLLLSQLERLAETPYFSPKLDSYIDDLCKVTRELLARLETTTPGINQGIARFAASNIWMLTQFLTGSTTKQIPYEVVYAIERAASEWTSLRLLVTTAIVQEANFYFHGGNEQFFQLAEAELGIKMESRPVQIALPYIYRHKPLFCIPLFHELGHYVDSANDIVGISLLLDPIEIGPDLPELPTAKEIHNAPANQKSGLITICKAHRQEYFADIFSAAYVGEAAKGFMKEFCPEQKVKPTHPSSAARYKVLDDFVAGVPNPIVDMFQRALAARQLPSLHPRFDSIELGSTIGAVRPFAPKSDRELFGLFESGWRFLSTQWPGGSGSWEHLAEHQRIEVANDLVEKSIRNRMIRESWDATTNAS